MQSTGMPVPRLQMPSPGSRPAPIISASNLDELLGYACAALQLTPTLYQLAEEHYHATAKWVGAPGSWFYNYHPQIFPQGSFRIGTTTKPILRNEYDLDFVLQLSLDVRVDPIELLNRLEQRLKDNATYRPMVERLNRCVRLNYAGKFHLDILPALPDGIGTRVKVPDRKLEDWKASDPKAYATWFEQRCWWTRMDKAAHVEPLPAIQAVEDQPVLKQVVQLAKRCRDRYPAFINDPKLSPRSIVLTTLIADAHDCGASTARTMYETIHALRDRVAWSSTPIEVWNPVCEKELLSEQWRDNPDAFHEYRNWLESFAAAWDTVLAAKSLEEQKRQLGLLFGEDIAIDAIEKHAARLDADRKLGGLKVTAAGGLVTSASARPVVRANTFYGKDD